MRSASANYNTYNALLNKNPVVAIEFDGANDKWVSGDFDDIGSPPGSVVYHKNIIEVRASWPEIKTYNTNFQAATFTIDLDDVAGVFAQFLSSGLPQLATLKLGFQEIGYADFVNITGSMLSVITVAASSIATWKLELRDSIFGIANIFVKYRDRKITLANNYTDVWTTGFQTVIGDGSTTVSQYFDELADYTNNVDQLGWRMFQQFDYSNNGICLIESDLSRSSLLDILEERILTPFGLYFYSNNGKISVASNDLMFNIETYTADGTLTDDEINYMSRRSEEHT